MNRPVKIILFVVAIILGSLLVYELSPLLAYFAVSLTGWGWLFVVLRPVMLLIFWVLMFRFFWPRKAL